MDVLEKEVMNSSPSNTYNPNMFMVPEYVEPFNPITIPKITWTEINPVNNINEYSLSLSFTNNMPFLEFTNVIAHSFTEDNARFQFTTNENTVYNYKLSEISLIKFDYSKKDEITNV